MRMYDRQPNAYAPSQGTSEHPARSTVDDHTCVKFWPIIFGSCHKSQVTLKGGVVVTPPFFNFFPVWAPYGGPVTRCIVKRSTLRRFPHLDIRYATIKMKTAGTNYIFPCTLFVEHKKSKTLPSLTFFVFILLDFCLTYDNYRGANIEPSTHGYKQNPSNPYRPPVVKS